MDHWSDPVWSFLLSSINNYVLPCFTGDFQFSVASDDNSEFWLSSDEIPANARLVAFVGKLGSEWTAPGEFTKFSSQVSKPVRPFLHGPLGREPLRLPRQDVSQGPGSLWSFSSFCPSDESSLKMNHVAHIPQSLASHTGSYMSEAQRDKHGADMLKPDPRDTFFLTPQIEASHVENVLVPCTYSPTYVVKDFPIARYQGLQFVYLSFVYPNDFTRLTHMETENKCFYRESPLYLENPEPTDPPPNTKEKSPRGPSPPLGTGTKGKGLPLAARDYGGDVDYYTFRHQQQPVHVESATPGRPRTRDVHSRASPSSAATARDSQGYENTPPLREQALVRGLAALDYNSSEAALSAGVRVTSFLRMSEVIASQQEALGKAQEEEEEVSDYSYENSELQPSWLEDSINWQRTFSVSSVDFELLRSDWNDLRCNVSGNLQLSESEVVDVVAQYMEKLNEKNGGIYTLLRIVNVEKRRDTARGNRYLLELELLERGQRTVRLSEYVYVLLHQGRPADSTEANPEGPTPMATEPQPSPWSLLYGKPILCRPLRLSWRQDVMVHFVVPVKNQARWVQQFIADMAGLYWDTKDANFNVILVDFESEDMDVEKALQEARLPRYQYLKRTGNFERSAGLQAGVDSIEDGRSIVFLCDLHIHFPLNILDSIRKHCVEGKLAYAPIVMRLGCGSSPRDPNGYWEVNGFGLFGIYKSDFDRVGGMNTEEFRDRWGGEDWELLDRVLQSGLEVERLRLRNFYHYYHSKRGMWNSRSKKAPKD
uniref:Hexosyltransferase n=1 Tax=Gopherus evgoodei TaxID=1825980 RepID=A0A8C4WT42_9SAUR